MATFPRQGRVVIAESISLRSMHVAWGTGDGAWTSPPSESPTATALLNELGRHTITAAQFVYPDAGGAIVLPSGNYSISSTPTNQLLISCTFDFGDSSSSIIREIGVFVGTVLNGGLPGGQTYFPPGDVADVGKLMYIENIAPIYRSPAVQETFKVVITF